MKRKLAAFLLMVAVIITQGQNVRKYAPNNTNRAENKDSGQIEIDDLQKVLSSLQKEATVSKRSSTDSVSNQAKPRRLPPYIESIISKIEKYWTPPSETNGLKVEVGFIIKRKGTVSCIQINKSSGNVMLDSIAVNAINSAAPFDTFPKTFLEDSLKLDVTLFPFRQK